MLGHINTDFIRIAETIIKGSLFFKVIEYILKMIFSDEMPSFKMADEISWIFQENWVDTMIANALAPYFARSSATMVLPMQN